MHGFIEWIKDHPKTMIAGVVGFIILVYLLNHSGGASTTASTDGTSTDAAAATALQTAQLAASSQANQVGAAVQLQTQQIAAQQQVAEDTLGYQAGHDQLAAQVATSQINADEQVQSLLGQLSSNVAINQSNNNLANTTVLATNQTSQQQILANALVTENQNNNATSQVAINASKDVATESLWNKIF